MRVSYNDYKLYLSILESVSKQLNKAIKSEASSKVTDEIPDHDFDGEANSSSVLDLVHICSGPVCSKLGRYSIHVLSPFCGSQIKFEFHFVNTYNFFAGVFILQFAYFLTSSSWDTGNRDGVWIHDLNKHGISRFFFVFLSV